jgi:glycosyltransferase involved in cell wall biosynthesis
VSHVIGPKVPLQDQGNYKRILCILPDFVWGGIGTSFKSLLKNFPEENVIIDVCPLKKTGIPFDPAFLRAHTALIRKRKAFRLPYDIAISYAHWINPTIWVGVVPAKRHIQWVHCDPKAHPEWVNSFKKQMQRIKAKQLDIDAFICVSNAAKDNFISCFPEYVSKTHNLYNIVDNEQILRDSKVPQTDMLKETGILRVVTVARLSFEKGVDIAIQVHSQLEKEGISFKWYVIGDGKERSALEALILANGLQGKFILLGHKDNPYPYIENADVFALFSREEGFGLVVTEAKILQRPIIITDFATAKEQIDSERNGLIVTQDVEVICQGMRKLILEKSLRARFSHALKGYRFNNKPCLKALRSVLQL